MDVTSQGDDESFALYLSQLKATADASPPKLEASASSLKMVASAVPQNDAELLETKIAAAPYKLSPPPSPDHIFHQPITQEWSSAPNLLK